MKFSLIFYNMLVASLSCREEAHQ